MAQLLMLFSWLWLWLCSVLSMLVSLLITVNIISDMTAKME